MSLESMLIDPLFKSSFDTLLKLQEVIRYNMATTTLAHD